MWPVPGSGSARFPHASRYGLGSHGRRKIARMIHWQDPPHPDEEQTAQDAVRLYAQMWSIERIAALFRTDDAALRRMIARRAALRAADRCSLSTKQHGKHR